MTKLSFLSLFFNLESLSYIHLSKPNFTLNTQIKLVTLIYPLKWQKKSTILHSREDVYKLGLHHYILCIAFKDCQAKLQQLRSGNLLCETLYAVFLN